MRKLLAAFFLLAVAGSLGACSGRNVTDAQKTLQACPDPTMGAAWCQGWVDDNRG